MKKTHIISILSLLLLVLSGAAFAADQNKQMDHTGHVGQKIHESMVDEHHIAYHLLDLPGRKEKHLVVYIKDPDGGSVSKAKVGYLVVGPDGVKQKVMAMGMKEAFGGDVDFSVKGAYAITVKAVIADVKLMDRFQYEIK